MSTNPSDMVDVAASTAPLPKSIFGVLLAQEGGDHLLLPNVAVLEVGNVYEAPAGVEPARWWRGHLDFEGIRVPVVDFELLNQGGAGDPLRARAVFVQTSGRFLQSPVIALLCRGHPHLVDVEPSALHAAANRADDRDELLLARVKLGNTLAAIPDFDTIEAELAQAGAPAR